MIRFIDAAILALLLSSCAISMERSSEPPKCKPDKPSVADRADYELWGRDHGLKLHDCRAICAAHLFLCSFETERGESVAAFCNGDKTCKVERI